MIEQNNHRKFYSEEQSPIPVPPVEDAWTSMKEKLNANLPVTGWQRFLKMVDQMAPRFSNMLMSRTWTV
ncbi:MAG TPA: hypothetical protein VFV08_05345, partial [Puia sp.]|nr:hypothetical protein [Puia sp.]